MRALLHEAAVVDSIPVLRRMRAPFAQRFKYSKRLCQAAKYLYASLHIYLYCFGMIVEQQQQLLTIKKYSSAASKALIFYAACELHTYQHI